MSASMMGSWAPIVSSSKLTDEIIRDLNDKLEEAKSVVDNPPKLASKAYFIDFMALERVKSKTAIEELRNREQLLLVEITTLERANALLQHEAGISPQAHQNEIEPDTRLDLSSPFVKSSDAEQFVPLNTTRPSVSTLNESISFKEWFINLIFHPSIMPAEPSALTFADNQAPKLRAIDISILSKIFFQTYAADGYDITGKTLTTTEISRDGKNSGPYSSEVLSKSVGWATFLGLPARPRLYDRAKVTWLKLGQNFLGGWQPLFNWSKGLLHPTFIGGKRAFWQIPLLIFVKIPIILPLKIIGVPLKMALNIIKLTTEFLPATILEYTGLIINHVPQFASKILGNTQSGELSNLGKLLMLMSATFILFLLHYTARVLLLIGTAATSPEKSARKAFASSRSLQVGNKISSAIIATILGVIGATLSVNFPCLFC
jgi:hypothetical protein